MATSPAPLPYEAESNVTRVTTPSGLEIAYCPEPRFYEVNGQRVPSVTEVLSVLHKPALTWWGMKVGVEGVLELVERDAFESLDRHVDPPALILNKEYANAEAIVRLLTEQKLTVNHVRDKAGTRGTSVHNAFERWAHTEKLPEPEEFPEDERGYVAGLRSFLEAVKPVPRETELMVASAEHGFAGRFDLLAKTLPRVVQPTPRKRRVIPPDIGIWDLKTSKGIYSSHLLQLAAYRLGLEESGYGRSDYEAVVQVGADGSWDVKVNTKRPEHFLAVRRCWEAVK